MPRSSTCVACVAVDRTTTFRRCRSSRHAAAAAAAMTTDDDGLSLTLDSKPRTEDMTSESTNNNAV